MYLLLPALVRLSMELLQLLRFNRAQTTASVAGEGVNDEPAAHADPPMNLPIRQLDAERIQRLSPGKHMLVDAIDQSSVQIEQEIGGSCAFIASHVAKIAV